MPFLSVDEFAQTIGLSPGSDGGAAPLLSFEELTAVADKLKRTAVDKNEFMSELASIYLPSLLRTVFGNVFSIRTHEEYIIWCWYSQQALDTMSLCHPMSQRFARLCELEARSFFSHLSQRIALVSQSPFNRDDDAQQFLPRITSLFQAFIAVLVLEGSSSFTAYPAIAASDRAHLASAAHQIRRRDPRVLPAYLPDVEGAAEVLEAFAYENLLDISRSRSDMIAQISCITWWRCEDGFNKDSGRQHEEENEKMMACSRCFAVRYCCKDHQRIDWKRHKKLCFKPSW